MFTTPAEQIKKIRGLNKSQKWGFTDKDFAKVSNLDIALPSANGLVTPVLVPYLATVQKTFDGLWKVIESQENTWRWDELKSDSKHLRLNTGKHTPGLRWELIDLGAHQGESPLDARKTTDNNLAHAGILAAAVLFPEWSKAMAGESVPYVNLSGYDAKYSTDWSNVPYLDRFDDVRQLGLRAGWADHAFRGWASPSVREWPSELGTSASALEPLELVISDVTINGRKYKLVEE